MGLLPSSTVYTLQVDNMATTRSHSILRHLTIAILILAIWTETTSAGQKCHKEGKKCVDLTFRGTKYTKNQCISGLYGYWCADKVNFGFNSGGGWNWECKDC